MEEEKEKTQDITTVVFDKGTTKNIKGYCLKHDYKSNSAFIREAVKEKMLKLDRSMEVKQ